MQCEYIKRDQSKCLKVIKKVGEKMCAEHRRTTTKKEPKEVKPIEPIEVKPETKPIEIKQELKPVEVKPKEEIKKEEPKPKPIKKILTFKDSAAYEEAIKLLDKYLLK